MGKLVHFSIEFANGGAVWAGQWLQGTVTLELNAPMKMRGIKMHLFGEADIHWAEAHKRSAGESSMRRKSYTYVGAVETYFDTTIIIWGKSGGSGIFEDNPTHPAGRYQYPFNFMIPASTPNSYSGCYGGIHYSAKAIIDKPWKEDHEVKEYFKVYSIFDLGLNQDAAKPVEGSTDKHLCCLCCALGGALSISANLEQKGWSVGQEVQLHGEIENSTNRVINKIIVEIEQKIMWHAVEMDKPTTKHIAGFETEPLQPGDTYSLEGKTIKVPDKTPPSLLHGCNIVDLSYVIKITADPSGPFFDLVLPLDMIIGTFPVRPGQVAAQAAVESQPQPQAPAQPSQQVPGQPYQAAPAQPFQPAPGQAAPAQPYQPAPGQAYPGQPYQAYPGQQGYAQAGGQPVQYQQAPGQPYYGQYPQGQNPGQQYPGYPQAAPGQTEVASENVQVEVQPGDEKTPLKSE